MKARLAEELSMREKRLLPSASFSLRVLGAEKTLKAFGCRLTIASGQALKGDAFTYNFKCHNCEVMRRCLHLPREIEHALRQNHLPLLYVPEPCNSLERHAALKRKGKGIKQ